MSIRDGSLTQFGGPMSPMPSINQAYGNRDERQKFIVANSGILGANPATTGSSNFDMAMFSWSGPSWDKKNLNLQYEFSKMKGHTKEVCCKLVGYPQDYNKFKKKRSSGRDQCDNMVDTYNVVTEGTGQNTKENNGVVVEVTHLDLDRRVREIGREENGLYILTGNTNVQHENSGCALAVKEDNIYGISEDVVQELDKLKPRSKVIHNTFHENKAFLENGCHFGEDLFTQKEDLSPSMLESQKAHS
ncbi:hypothetical protein KY289_011965 [Solanum tuberosum]|nr:hypothetical protein KY289_011965 [Solanum tuberosum]